MSAPHPTPAVAGVLYALGAYGSWGLLPVYWKQLTRVPVFEILAHRVVWSVVFTALLLTASRSWPNVCAALSSRRNLVTLLATSLLIGTNWFLFIWAVTHGEVLASSLGYFLNPLVNVALAVVFLRERLRPWPVASIALAAFRWLCPPAGCRGSRLCSRSPSACFTPAHGVAFACIWIALAVYSTDALRAQRTRWEGDPALREPSVAS